MATYPIKILKDESGQPFVPLTSLDAVVGEKNLQYIINATETSAGHFNINLKDVTLQDMENAVIVIRWPQISSTIKPSYLQLNDETEAILYDGNGIEYLSLEESSNTVNLFAFDGEKWILTSGAGSGGGSGHVITDELDRTLPQQKILNFIGFNVENDATNRATKIINPTPINNLETTESGLGSLDAYQGRILSQRSVPTGGTKGQVLAKSDDGDYLLTWADPGASNADSISSDGSVKKIVNLTYAEYKELESKNEIDPLTQYYINDMAENNITFITEEEIEEIVEQAVADTKEELTNTKRELNDLLSYITPQDVSEDIVVNTDNVHAGAHQKLIKSGDVYVYDVAYVTDVEMAAKTSYNLATIPAEHWRQGTASLQGLLRANNDYFVSFWISNGVVDIYPIQTLPAGTNLAGNFVWIKNT